MTGIVETHHFPDRPAGREHERGDSRAQTRDSIKHAPARIARRTKSVAPERVRYRAHDLDGFAERWEANQPSEGIDAHYRTVRSPGHAAQLVGNLLLSAPRAICRSLGEAKVRLTSADAATVPSLPPDPVAVDGPESTELGGARPRRHLHWIPPVDWLGKHTTETFARDGVVGHLATVWR